MLPFTLEFSRLTPDEFVQAVLVDRLHAARVVVGENFRFGHKAAGDVALLAELGEQVRLRGGRGAAAGRRGPDHLLRRTSGTCWPPGTSAGAARDLGRPHRVEGVVVRGDQPRPRRSASPPPTWRSPPHTAIPARRRLRGLAARWTRTATRSERWPAAISIGTNPTFDGKERTVEAYALDRDDLDLYGAHAAVDFAARLRGTVRFDSVDDLVEQMHRDVDEARQLTGPGG